MLDPYNYLKEERLDEAKGDAMAEYKKFTAAQKQLDVAKRAYEVAVESMIGAVSNALRKAGKTNNLGLIKVEVQKIDHDVVPYGGAGTSSKGSMRVKNGNESIMVGIPVYQGRISHIQTLGKSVQVRSATPDDIAIKILQELGWVQ